MNSLTAKFATLQSPPLSPLRRYNKLPLSRISGGLFLLAPVLLLAPVSARAAQTFYQGPNNGTWTDGNNWDVGTAPVAGDDAVIGGFIPSRSADVNVTFDASYASGSALYSVTLDSTGTNGSVIVNQSASGSALAASNEYIGNTTARNVYNQSAGSNTFGSNSGSLYIGYAAGSNGTYNLSGSGSVTASSATTSMFVGYSGNGTFTQTNGTIIGGTLNVGYNSGSVGTYNLSGGSFNTGPIGNISVGGQFDGQSNVKGTFNQTGGTGLSGGFLTVQSRFFGAAPTISPQVR